jgi:hypothetical protein
MSRKRKKKSLLFYVVSALCFVGLCVGFEVLSADRIPTESAINVWSVRVVLYGLALLAVLEIIWFFRRK